MLQEYSFNGVIEVIGVNISTVFQYLIGTITGTVYIFTLIYLYAMLVEPWALVVGLFYGIPVGLVFSYITVFSARRKTKKTIGVIFCVLLYLTGQCGLGWAGSFIGSKIFSAISINEALGTFGAVAGFVNGYIVGNLAISKLINYVKSNVRK